MVNKLPGFWIGGVMKFRNYPARDTKRNSTKELQDSQKEKREKVVVDCLRKNMKKHEMKQVFEELGLYYNDVLLSQWRGHYGRRLERGEYDNMWRLRK